VARDEDGGSLLLCFMLCTRKVEDLCIWISVVIYDAIAMITIFYTMVVTPQNWHLVNYSNHATIHMMLPWKRTTKQNMMQHTHYAGGIK
jgi:hypothetical protein